MVMAKRPRAQSVSKCFVLQRGLTLGPRALRHDHGELELELIQYQMTQKPMLRGGGEGAPVRAANKPRSQEKKGGVCVVSHCL